MKTKEDAAKVLLENGFSLEDVLNLLGNQQTVIYPYIPMPTVEPKPWWAEPWRITWGDVSTDGTKTYTTDRITLSASTPIEKQNSTFKPNPYAGQRLSFDKPTHSITVNGETHFEYGEN